MLDGKICIVTGAAQGIGHCIAELFAQNHAKAVYACDRKTDGLADLARQHDAIIPVELDVTDRSAIEHLVAEIGAKHQTIDVLVNNAGITRDALIGKMTEADWSGVIAVNLTGVFNFTQAVAPVMMVAGRGSIVSMSSVVGTDGNIGQSNYAAAKGGIISMTKGWAKEFAYKGAQVRVYCVAPGFIETSMTANLPEKVIDGLKEKAPLKRMGKPEEIAEGVLFLASDRSSFITGQTLKIDGGLVI